MKFFCSLFLFASVSSLNGINKKCMTPHGELSRCRELTSCKHLYDDLVSRPNDSAVRSYLIQAKCGVRKGVPLICCGSPVKVYHECGQVEGERSKFRIYGDKIVMEHFPWMAALQYAEEDESPEFRCAGFLINSQFVVTAAHCLKSEAIKSVHLGTSNLTDYNKQNSHIEAKIVDLDYHEDYINYENDIGLIRIKPINYTDYIRWICLPSGNESLPNWFTLRGWGENDISVKTFTIALENQLKFVRYNDCPNALRRNLSNDRIFCAGGGLNRDSCRGDSGGALMNRTQKGWTVYGIVSFGSQNCLSGHPAIYTKFHYYLDWLDRAMIRMLSKNEI